MRTLGGSIGLAAGVAIFNRGVRDSAVMHSALTPSQISSLYHSPIIIETFTSGEQVMVARVFAEAFTQQMQVATYISAACLVFSLSTWERNPPQDAMLLRPQGPQLGRDEKVHQAGLN
jgi:hypothetical protein